MAPLQLISGFPAKESEINTRLTRTQILMQLEKKQKDIFLTLQRLVDRAVEDGFMQDDALRCTQEAVQHAFLAQSKLRWACQHEDKEINALGKIMGLE
jgi:hypothetical protein